MPKSKPKTRATKATGTKATGAKTRTPKTRATAPTYRPTAPPDRAPPDPAAQDRAPTDRPPAPPDPATPLDFRTQTLSYLDAVARYGTFSQASRALHISQPAISQAIASFEEQLGVKLLKTQGRRKVLTPAGQHVAEFSAEVLGKTQELRRWLDSYEAGSRGSLRVGMIDAAVLYILPQALEQYRRARPQVELQIIVAESNALLRRLTNFEIDLALMIEPTPAEFVSRTIMTEKLYRFSPPDEAVLAWALPPSASRTRALIDRGLAGLGITPNVILESRNPIVLRQMAALGLSHAVLPRALAQDSPPLLKAEAGFVCERTVLAVQRPGDTDDVAGREFIELAQQAAGG